MTPEEKQIRNHIFKQRETIADDVLQILDKVLPTYTMLPLERIYDLYKTVIQLNYREVPGDFAEFGVWRGGSLASIAMASRQTSLPYFDEISSASNGTEAAPVSEIDWTSPVVPDRKIFGFDTFSGHSAPLDWEVDIHGKNQRVVYEEVKERDGSWAACSLEEVQSNLKSILGNYPDDFITLIKGDGAITGPEFGPVAEERGLALLRLDMDWYEPTIKCLETLGQYVPVGGLVILDDFGHHSGVRKAAKEYFSSIDRRFDVTKTDYSCARVVFLS